MKFGSIIRMDFNFGNLMHSALVSISGDAKENFIHVQLLQSFFKNVFGVEHIRFLNQNGNIEMVDFTYPFQHDIARTINNKLGHFLFENTPFSLKAIRD